LFDDDVIFSPDSKRLFVSFGSDSLEVLSTDDWHATRMPADPLLENFRSLGFAGAAPDGSMMVVGGWLGTGASSLHWLHPDTLEFDRSRSQPNIDDGSIKSIAVSREGRRVATGSSDGFIRVWDELSGALLHEIPFGDVQVQGVAFVDDAHIAVVPQGGSVYIETTDPQELLTLARRSLTRGFTETECSRYGIGQHCPTLEELRAG
jgi:WD40 repeat protein